MAALTNQIFFWPFRIDFLRNKLLSIPGFAFGHKVYFDGFISIVFTLDKSVKPMEWFHDNVNIYPALGPKIAIPNSMWTVGCC